MIEPYARIILASASRSRAKLLEAARLSFDVIPSDLDEGEIKSLAGDPTNEIQSSDVALLLAQAKALSVSQRYPQALVIGADQTLILDEMLLDKPADRQEAQRQLLMLRGKAHWLDTAAAGAHNGAVFWTTRERSRLTMREFSSEALAAYLSAAGDDLTSSVGGYKIEGPAIRLFTSIEGDYFSILGLPLLAVLQMLRDTGVMDE